MPDDSVQLRLAAFSYLDRLLRRGPYVTREELRAFTFGDETFPLISGAPRGIYKPTGWTTVMSILSSDVPVSAGGYEDEYRADGTLLYKFMNPEVRSSRAYNDALLETARQQLPLILLEKVESKLFEPIYPVWIGAQVDDAVIVSGVLPDTEIAAIVDLASELKKRYAIVQGRRRLHQEVFRSQVLFAYGNRCAICNLGRRGLLDAAHIIDDAEDEGEPIVQNGLALCRIHHGAYDQFLIGIRPDLRIEVAEDVLQEIDGPMLEHGLKGISGRRIAVPQSAKKRPHGDRLEWKYERFRERSLSRA
jgi:putative restriction endonuclease